MIGRGILVLFLLALLVSCGPTGTIQPSPLSTVALAVVPTVPPAVSPSLRPVPPIPPSPTAVPSPNAETVQPPVGLIFRTDEGIWRVEAKGQPVLLFSTSDYAILSPEALRGTNAGQALVISSTVTGTYDIWMIDLASGKGRNLTNTPERRECCPQWWPARPDTILFGSWGQDDFQPDYGYLTAIGVDGSDYRLLDSEAQSWADFAPSPDGRFVAYDHDMTAWLYRWDSGPEPIDLASFGLTADKVGSPSWSPDGKQLAWIAGSAADETWQLSVAVLDLEDRTGRLLHPIEPTGRGGWAPPAIWSPDGQWLAYPVWPVADHAGVWLLKADGTEERYLGPYSFLETEGSPVWSPDSQWVIYTTNLSTTRHTEPDTTWLVDVETGRARLVTLPTGAVVLAWIEKQ